MAIRHAGQRAPPGFDDHADDLKLEYVDGASHFVADDRHGAVLERALELFAQP